MKLRAVPVGLAIAGLLVVGVAGPASAGATSITTVTHGETETVHFPDDVCGPRASVVTFTRNPEVAHFTFRPDGSVITHLSARVTYVVDFVDPALGEASGALTEVETFNFTPSETLIYSLTFHDFAEENGSEIKIWQRMTLVMVDGVPVVDREVFKFTGCP